MKEQQVRIAAAGSRVQSRHDDGAELEALGLVDGHDLEVIVRRVNVGKRVEALERVAQAREVGDRTARLELLKRVEVALGVFELGLVRDAGGAGKREPDAFDRLAQASATTVRYGGREHGGELREE